MIVRVDSFDPSAFYPRLEQVDPSALPCAEGEGKGKGKRGEGRWTEENVTQVQDKCPC